jgi:hypothetical protein
MEREEWDGREEEKGAPGFARLMQILQAAGSRADNRGEQLAGTKRNIPIGKKNRVESRRDIVAHYE